jgi:hypothetical protein
MKSSKNSKMQFFKQNLFFIVTVFISLIIAVLVCNIYSENPNKLNRFFLGFILAGALCSALATFTNSRKWILLGTIIMALSGFGTSYVSDLILDEINMESQFKLDGLKTELAQAREDTKYLTAILEQNNRQNQEDKEKTQKRLEVLHQRLYNSLPSDAEIWAKKFVENKAIIEEEIKLNLQKQKDEYNKQILEIPAVFKFILKTFDEYIQALVTKGETIRSDSAEQPFETLFIEGDASSIFQKSVRKIYFQNGKSIEVKIKQGRYINGAIKEYPFLKFEAISEASKHPISEIQFQHMVGKFIAFGGLKIIDHPLNASPYEMEKLKERLNSIFYKMISETMI